MATILTYGNVSIDAQELVTYGYEYAEDSLAKQPVLESLPKYQAISSADKKLKLSLKLVWQFGDPLRRLDLIETAYRERQIAQVVWGTGLQAGTFLVTGLGVRYRKTDGAGRLIAAEVDMTLVETPLHASERVALRVTRSRISASEVR